MLRQLPWNSPQDFILFLIAGLLAQVVDSQNPIGWTSLVAHPQRSIMSAWECDLEFYYCEARKRTLFVIEKDVICNRKRCYNSWK